MKVLENESVIIGDVLFLTPPSGRTSPEPARCATAST
jgi:hypothetical protein